MTDLRLPLTAVLVSLLAACAASPSRDASESVVLTNRAPSHCTSLGTVTATQSHGPTSYFDNDADRLRALRNDLQSRTAAAGGNTVFVQAPDNTGVFASAGTPPESVTGQAYSCTSR